MKRRTYLLIFICLLLAMLCNTAQVASFAGPNHKVLVLLSYDPSFPTTQDILDGVNTVFDRRIYDLDIEFMDTKEVHSEDCADQFCAYFSAKVKRKKTYDLVLTFDDNALRFVMENKKDLFPSVPIVFAGVNDLAFARQAAADEQVTGVVEAVSIRETLHMITLLQPDMRKLYVIVDNTVSGQADLDRVRKAAPEIEQVEMNFSNRSPEDFTAQLERVSRADAILLLSAFEGYEGTSYTFYESLSMIVEYANAPVYHLWMHGMGEGLAGGKVISQYNQAVKSSQIGKKILEGDRVSEQPLIDESPNQYAYDYSVLIRYGLDPSKLPEESLVLNRPLGLREENPILYWKIVLLVVSLVLLVLVLLIVLYYRRKETQQILQNNAYLDRLINTITLPIVVKNERNEFVLVNRAFQIMTQLPMEQLIGAKSDTVFRGETLRLLRDMDHKLTESTKVEQELILEIEGATRTFNIIKTASIDPAGNPVIVAIAEEVTEIRAYQQALLEHAQTLEEKVEQRTRELVELNDALRQMSMTDQLTKVSNRRSLDSLIEEEIERFERYRTLFSIVMVDVDHFKYVNDEYGHQKGDDVLIRLSQALVHHTRATDKVGRWGGEEFLIVCPNTNEDEALATAEKLRKHIEEAQFLEEQKITCSFGVATMHKNSSAQQMIKRADDALYEAKEGGRNQVRVK